MIHILYNYLSSLRYKSIKAKKDYISSRNIYVVGYPISGNSWIAYLITYIMNCKYFDIDALEWSDQRKGLKKYLNGSNKHIGSNIFDNVYKFDLQQGDANEISKFVIECQMNEFLFDKFKCLYYKKLYSFNYYYSRYINNILMLKKKYISKIRFKNLLKFPIILFRNLICLYKNTNQTEIHDMDNNPLEPTEDWRGRYDNRIKSGDELFWFRIFEKSNIKFDYFNNIYNHKSSL